MRMCYTYKEEGTLNSFVLGVEEKIFSKQRGLEPYPWTEDEKKEVLQKNKSFKASACNRNEHLNILYDYLIACEHFYWRVYRVIKVCAEEELEELNNLVSFSGGGRVSEFGIHLKKKKQIFKYYCVLF